MTHEDAFQEIGIAPGSSPDEIRRAYLRLVKVRKPESDPEGFRRLREAYDFLRDLPAPVPGFFVEHDPPAEPPAGPLATAHVSEIDAFLSGFEKELEAASSPEERVARLRAAVADNPQDVRLCWWLVEELEELEQTDDLEAFLRRCDRQGFPGFFEKLALRFPRSLGLEDLARLEQLDNAAARIRAAEAWLSRGQAGRAVEAVLGALQMAEARMSFPPPSPVLALLLRLQAQGHATDAARLQERFQRFLYASSQELVLDGWASVLWQIAQEMSRLSPEFPASARAAIGEAVAAGVPQNALHEIDRLIQEDGDAGWRMAAELKDLHFLGSLYHGAILDTLAKRSPPVVGEPASSWDASDLGRWIFGVGWALFFLFRTCSAPTPSVPEPYLDASVPVVSLEQALLAACPSETVLTQGQSVLCHAARNAANGLRQRRCYDVRATRGELMEGLQMVKGETGELAGKTLITAIQVEYANVCRAVF